MEGCPPLLLSILNTNSSSALLTLLFSRTVKSTYSFAHIWALTFWGTLCPSGIAADKKECTPDRSHSRCLKQLAPELTKVAQKSKEVMQQTVA